MPQPHIEDGVLASHETRYANTVAVADRERQYQQRPALHVIGNHYEKREILSVSDLPLPRPGNRTADTV